MIHHVKRETVSVRAKASLAVARRWFYSLTANIAIIAFNNPHLEFGDGIGVPSAWRIVVRGQGHWLFPFDGPCLFWEGTVLTLLVLRPVVTRLCLPGPLQGQLRLKCCLSYVQI